MPRHKKSEFSRDIGVDQRFQSPLIQKLINTVMERGKKSLACAIVYEAFDIIAKKTENNDQKAFECFSQAFENVVPLVEVAPRRVGGSVYQIPREVAPRRARALGIRWIISAAAARSNKTMGQRLAYEILDAFENRGGAVKKRGDVQRMAESNRAFSHFAW
jgi:small subunit ribosomal protein S7